MKKNIELYKNECHHLGQAETEDILLNRFMRFNFINTPGVSLLLSTCCQEVTERLRCCLNTFRAAE